MYITVIIPTYHDWNRLQLCLDALEKQSLGLSKFEIIIVNNDPNDDVPSNLSLPKNCIITSEAKAGSYAARNKAIGLAKGDVFAFTDSDCQPECNWLEKSVEHFRKDPKLERIGGKITLIFKSNRLTLAEYYESVYAFRQKEFVNESGMAATGNMIAKAHIFESIGLFNDKLLSGGDAEWGKRAHASGYKISYFEDCIVRHPTRDKMAYLTKKTRREAGGHLLISNQSTLKSIFSIFVGFLPPMGSMYKIIRMQEYTAKEMSIAFIIRYYLRIIASTEKALLLLKVKNAERV